MPPSVSIWVLEKFQARRLRKECLEIFAEVGRVGVEASTAQASFAMLRGLHLERQLRVASLVRQNEAVAALTRGVVEATLIGLYLALDPGGLDRHMGFKGVRRLVALAPRIRDGGFEGPVGEASLEELARLIGPPGVPIEDLMAMWRAGYEAAEDAPPDDETGS